MYLHRYAHVQSTLTDFNTQMCTYSPEKKTKNKTKQ